MTRLRKCLDYYTKKISTWITYTIDGFMFSVATRGSVLYFLIVEMSVVNTMYQTSLRQFLQVFDVSMARSVKSPITSRRIQNIIEYLTFSTFSYTVRGLYEIDKFLFTILMTLKIQMQAKAIRGEEFQCFIKGEPPTTTIFFVSCTNFTEYYHKYSPLVSSSTFKNGINSVPKTDHRFAPNQTKTKLN